MSEPALQLVRAADLHRLPLDGRRHDRLHRDRHPDAGGVAGAAHARPESGARSSNSAGPAPSWKRLPLAVGGGCTFHRALAASGIRDIVETAQRGFVEYGFPGRRADRRLRQPEHDGHRRPRSSEGAPARFGWRQRRRLALLADDRHHAARPAPLRRAGRFHHDAWLSDRAGRARGGRPAARHGALSRRDDAGGDGLPSTVQAHDAAGHTARRDGRRRTGEHGLRDFSWPIGSTPIRRRRRKSCGFCAKRWTRKACTSRSSPGRHGDGLPFRQAGWAFPGGLVGE